MQSNLKHKTYSKLVQDEMGAINYWIFGRIIDNLYDIEQYYTEGLLPTVAHACTHSTSCIAILLVA